MTDDLKSWLKDNHALALFLVAQAIAMLAAAASILAYSVKLETRVTILETRGAAYTVEKLDTIDRRITVLEQNIEKNTKSIDRIVEVLTRELKK